MKTIKLFVYALIVCMSFVGVAEAKGRTGSFKSGFSSQKRAVPKPAPIPYQAPPKNTPVNNAAFGSFGNANTKTTTAPQSQMSKDLNANTAQSNALKTADARTATNEKTNTTNSESGWFRSGSQSATQNPNTPTNKGTTPQPATLQYSGGRQSSGLMPGLIGFMLGHSLAQQHSNAVPQHNEVAGQENQNVGQVNSTVADGLAAQQVQDVPVVEQESFFLKLLRVVLWVAIIGGIVWVARKLLGFRNRNLHQAANYSLRS